MSTDVLTCNFILFSRLVRLLAQDAFDIAMNGPAELRGQHDVRMIEQRRAGGTIFGLLQSLDKRMQWVPQVVVHHIGLVLVADRFVILPKILASIVRLEPAHIARLDEMGSWFCEQRHLDNRAPERPELARMSESLNKVGDTIAGAARTTTRSIAASPSRVRNRGNKDDDPDDQGPAELTP